MATALIVLGIGFCLFWLVILFLSIRIVRPVEVGIVERFGKYKRTSQQGLTFIIPLVDRMIKVNITEIRVDVEPQTVITRDNLNTIVDAVVYYKVVDSMKALYKVNNYHHSIVSLAQTTLRAVIGKMNLSEVNENRNEINRAVERELDEQTDAWGIDITRVELQKVDPPRDVQDAMNMVVKAENEKIAAQDLATATETKADGARRAEIKMAEGEARAIMLRADAHAVAKERIAKADAEVIRLVNESVQKHFKNEAQIYKKLETIEKSLQTNTKIVVPGDTSLINIISDMAGVAPIPIPGKPKKAGQSDRGV
ncbi:MAG: SPFH domain-containing protein [Candidatus Micrarchaeota archaeon]